MEVHHHAHPLTSSVHRKKWTHYFWEFLMLFLAVFCGFLAEYQLEHKIEKDRAKEYAILLMEDLRNDSAYVGRLEMQHHFKINQADSLLELLDSANFMNRSYRFVHHFNHVGTLIDFKPAFPVNFEQMKNSGSLRYLRNEKLVGELSALNRQLEVTAEVYTGHNNFILQYLTPFSIQHLNTQQYDIFSRKVLVRDPDLYDFDKKEARLLANKVNLTKTYDLFFLKSFLADCKDRILLTRKMIRKEYDLNKF